MKIEFAELRLVHLDLLRPFETSFGVETGRTVPILRCSPAGWRATPKG